MVLVENGSTDGTWGECSALSQLFPGVVVATQIPRGSYGEAIKKGMMVAKESHVAILECDFLLPTFLSSCMDVFSSDMADVVVASKRHPRSVDERPLKRRLLTYGFNAILHAALRYPGSDTHGLKAFPTSVAQKLCSLSQTTDEVFQTEIILIAWRLGYRIAEVPIEIREKRATPVTIVKRVPKVANIIRDLRQSLRRFPPNTPKTPACDSVNPYAEPSHPAHDPSGSRNPDAVFGGNRKRARPPSTARQRIPVAVGNAFFRAYILRL